MIQRAPTSEPDEPQAAPRRKGRFGLWLMMVLAVLTCAFLVAIMSLTGRVVILPDWMTARIEARLDATVAPADISIGRTRVKFSRRGVPGVFFTDVGVSDGEGRPLAQLPDLSVTLVGKPLLEGRVVVRRVALMGAQIALGRRSDGQFDLSLGDSVSPVQAQTLGQVLDQIDQAFAEPFLSSIESVTIEELQVSYTDSRAGRFWRIRDGLMTLDQDQERLSAQVFFSMRSDSGAPSEVALSLESVKGSPEARISANFSDVPADDIATQSPALAFLGVIEAPISGALRAGVAADGSLAPLNAALQIGEGALRPVQDAVPIRFERGKAYFSYDPALDKITLDEVSVKTDALSLVAEGHAYLKDHVDDWPSSLTTQIRLRHVELAPHGVFAEPARFSSGAADFKLTLDPFTATIGQAVLRDENGANYRGSGLVNATQKGWSVALDLALNQIQTQAMLGLWPVSVAPQTRTWVADNVHEGLIFDVRGALRLAPEVEPVASLTYEFRDARVRFMKTMPMVENGYGYSSISENGFTMALERGTVTAPSGGKVEAGGTIVRVNDIRQRPAMGHVTLKTDSSVQAMLSLLDLPPLSLLSRAGQPVDMAHGRARVEADLRLPFVKNTKAEEVTYDVNGLLTSVKSDSLIKGRLLSAKQLTLHADNAGLSISGEAELDGVPVNGVWSQKSGAEHRGQSTVEGTLGLSQHTVDVFGLGLPANSIIGRGRGAMTLNLRRDAPTVFSLTSDLAGLGMQMPGIGWSKDPAQTGRLLVQGSLAQPLVVTNLEFTAPGVSALEGRAAMKPDGSLDQLAFGQVVLGEWLDAPVVLRGQGPGAAPQISLAGGQIDLRNSPLMSEAGRGSDPAAAGNSAPIILGLDRMIVSNSIALTGVTGTLSSQPGLEGNLSAQVQGGAPVSITLAPTQGGTAIRVTSADAGGVMRGAGIFKNSVGGDMDMLLAPLGPPGSYDGQLVISRTRVKEAPALAELLSAISVVGLLDVLDGEGLMFNDVQARFRLTPQGLEVKRGSAVGPSMGISMAGIMNFKTNRMKMQGVISPIYVINGLGQIFSRRGEGLFGFNYELVGDAKSPEVRVNPLSIFTPGMFREIFRRPAPELKN